MKYLVTFTNGTSDTLTNVTTAEVEGETASFAAGGYGSSIQGCVALFAPRLVVKRDKHVVRTYLLHAVRDYGFVEEDS